MTTRLLLLLIFYLSPIALTAQFYSFPEYKKQKPSKKQQQNTYQKQQRRTAPAYPTYQTRVPSRPEPVPPARYRKPSMRSKPPTVKKTPPKTPTAKTPPKRPNRPKPVPPAVGSKKAIPHTFNYARVDAQALNVGYSKDVRKLTYALTQNLHQDYEKARAIFRWIADNIEYDCQLSKQMKEGKGHNRNADEVLDKGKAVCGGYSALLAKMCELAGVRCEIVRGFARSKLEHIGYEMKGNNHAWNVINLQGRWYLMDVTWAAGYGSCNGGGFEKEWKEAYFLADPQHFAKNHFPQNPKWQLLQNPVKLDTYSQAPHHWYAYFDLGMQNLAPQTGVLNVRKNQPVVFSFTVYKNQQYPFTIGLEEKRDGKTGVVPQQNVPVTFNDGKYELSYRFEKKGEYYAHLIVDEQIVASYKMVVK